MDVTELANRLNQLTYRVSQLERTLAAMSDQGVIPSDFPDDLPPTEYSQYPDITEALQKGKFMDAIKLYRGYTGVGLEEAKRVLGLQGNS